MAKGTELVATLRDIVGLPPAEARDCESCGEKTAPGERFCLDCAPEPEDDGRPLCKNGLCAEMGIRADDKWGWCRDCSDARAEDAAEARAEAIRNSSWDY
jgi:hypothetical protein